MDNNCLQARETAAQRLFESGSVKVDLVNGFPIAIHQKHPHAPRSPFYLNMRPHGVKNGTLTPEDIKCIARATWLKGLDAKLFGADRPVCTIPAAGTPFMNAIMAFLRNDRRGRGMPHEFYLKKDEGEVRSFSLLEPAQAHLNTLMTDDLVTNALSKILAAKPILEAGGTVTDVLVFLNRSLTARADLLKKGMRLHAAWEFEEFIAWALKHGYINDTQFVAIDAYPQLLDDYIATQPAV